MSVSDIAYMIERARGRLPMTIAGVEYIAAETVSPQPPVINVAWLKVADVISITLGRERFGIKADQSNWFLLEPSLAQVLSDAINSALTSRTSEKNR